jgi:hypothetical protein
LSFGTPRLMRSRHWQQDLVRAGGADVIIAQSTPAALATYKATQTIPIVVFAAVDPVGSGLADSLANPGRSVTGVTVFCRDRDHLAVIPLAPQPTEKGAFEQLGVETISLGAPVLARYG